MNPVYFPAYSIFVNILENQHHGKSCYVEVWGDVCYTIYIPIKKENVLKLPVEIPDGQVGKLSNPVPPPSTTCVVFEQAVLHVTVDVQLTA